MQQGEARQRARELRGLAISARRSPATGRWITGGWPKAGDEWIVISLDRRTVLDDARSPETED